jgi:penicillin-binding protein 1C
VWHPLRRSLDDSKDARGLPLFCPEAAWLTLDMLKDGVRPDNVLSTSLQPKDARPVAWKTGTSFSYRDAWCAGVFDHYVLVVWVGNFDGEVNSQFVGRTAAAPLFFSLVDALREREPDSRQLAFVRTPDLNLHQVDLCAVSGMVAGPHCAHTVKDWFIPGKSPIATCDIHRRIWIDNATGLRLSGPPDNPATAHAEVWEFWPSDLARIFQAAGVPRQEPPAFLSADQVMAGNAAAGKGPNIVSPKKGIVYHVRVSGSDEQMLNLEATAETGRTQLRWFVDAAYLGTSAPSTALLWKLQPGEHVIRAVDEQGRTDSRQILVTSVQ